MGEYGILVDMNHKVGFGVPQKTVQTGHKNI
jgi:hypothetical protein